MHEEIAKHITINKKDAKQNRQNQKSKPKRKMRERDPLVKTRKKSHFVIINQGVYGEGGSQPTKCANHALQLTLYRALLGSRKLT